MKSRVIGLILGILATPVALLLAIVSAGAGHGDYLAAGILYPVPMLVAIIFEEINPVVLGLACLQFPVYGWLSGVSWASRKPKIALWLLTSHAVSLGLFWLLRDGGFY